jgi:hypothetical protein
MTLFLLHSRAAERFRSALPQCAHRVVIAEPGDPEKGVRLAIPRPKADLTDGWVSSQ